MAKKTPMYEALQGLTFLTQVGVSVAMPLVLCLFGAAWLQQRFQLGGWVVVVGLMLGIGGACSSLLSFIRWARRRAEKNQTSKEERSSFNDRW